MPIAPQQQQTWCKRGLLLAEQNRPLFLVHASSHTMHRKNGSHSILWVNLADAICIAVQLREEVFKQDPKSILISNDDSVADVDTYEEVLLHTMQSGAERPMFF